MPLPDFLKQSLDILGTPARVDVQPTAGHIAQSRRWSLAAQVLGSVGLVLLAVYWLTSILPEWIGYVLGPIGLAAWACVINAQQSRRQ